MIELPLAIGAYLSFDEAFWTVNHPLEQPSLASQFSLDGVCDFLNELLASGTIHMALYNVYGLTINDRKWANFHV